MEVDNSTTFNGNSRCFIDDLPDEVMEYILSLIPPYNDLENCKLVCKRWQKNVLNVIYHKKNDFNRSVGNFSVKWEKVTAGATISKRYSHSACSHGNSMYVFGGCTCNSTTFNDLWRLDLSTRKWLRLLTLGTYPTPKACATIAYYNDSLVLFGGWTHPSPYPMHQQWRMFNDLHIYDINSRRWTCIMSPTYSPPPMAGHSATIHRDTMVVFGGLHDINGCSNDIWCFDLITHTWRIQKTTEPKPLARYGQSQIVLDPDHLIILGGCLGVPNTVLTDVWLLYLTKDVWKWRQIKVNNTQWAAPHLWCHPACKIGNNVIVFSRNPSSTVPKYAYSKWSSTNPRAFGHSSDEDSDEFPFGRTEEGAVIREHIDRDININGRRGSLTPRNRVGINTPGPSHQTNREKRHDPVVNNNSLNPGAGPSTSQDRMSNNMEKISDNKRVEPTRSYNSNYARPIRDFSANELPMAAFRSNTGANNLGRQREMQLVALHRMEEKIRHEQQQKREAPKLPTIKLVPMAMFVLDISSVISDHEVSWLPLKSVPEGSPEDTILYTLVVGNGELIMFGGIQIDATAITLNIQSSLNNANTVSNELHFITAPLDII